MRAYGVEADKIHVVYLGRDERLTPVTDPLRAGRQCGRSTTWRSATCSTSGTLQPRKNLARVVQAFEAICGRPRTGRDAARAGGQARAGSTTSLFAQVERSGLSERVLFPGYVPDEDVPALLSAATAFVFPSLYEGFGIPVLEAGACGVPVITCNTSSLPEVAGDAALLVDPHDVDAIAEAMYRLVTDPTWPPS